MIGHFLASRHLAVDHGRDYVVLQMKLNPDAAGPDAEDDLRLDAADFHLHAVSRSPAGLVIYWAWNNTLSVLQQSFIMRKNGVKVELFDNIKSTFAKKAIEKT